MAPAEPPERRFVGFRWAVLAPAPSGCSRSSSATVMVWTSEVWLGFGACNCQCDGTPFVDPSILGGLT